MRNKQIFALGLNPWVHNIPEGITNQIPRKDKKDHCQTGIDHRKPVFQHITLLAEHPVPGKAKHLSPVGVTFGGTETEKT